MRKNSVICAIDVNDFDQEVVDLAAEFSRHFGVALDILHVTLSHDPGQSPWPAGPGSSNLEFIIQDNRRLREIGSRVEGVEIYHHHLSGIPSRKILEFTERNQPQLLVMGTHGRQGFKRVFGSVASRVLRYCECPVMVLRQRQSDQQEDDRPSESEGTCTT